jgi:DNA end-binding protein Ku
MPMAARSIASLTLSFGLVSIPVKLYSATESASSVRFNMLDKDGARLKQQYVSEKTQKVVERAEMVKGYEFEADRFVLFEPEELKALQESPSHSIDIVAFVPTPSVDPVFYDKAYFLAPDKRGAKPYNLLMEAMRESGRSALAKWAWKGKQYVVQVRPAEDGLVLQQLLYADEVRSLKELDIEKVAVSAAELKLAMQLIDQISTDTYDPTLFEDEEKKRILAAIDEKIAGKQIVAQEPKEPQAGAQVIDLMEALRASLGSGGAPKASAEPAKAAPKARAEKAEKTEKAEKAAKPAANKAPSEPAEVADAVPRKGAARAARPVEEAAAPAARARARK